jgi:hypothetical protein
MTNYKNTFFYFVKKYKNGNQISPRKRNFRMTPLHRCARYLIKSPIKTRSKIFDNEHPFFDSSQKHNNKHLIS